MMELNTEVIEKIVWDFPGGIWGLAAAAALLIVVTAVSYRFSLHRLGFRQRAVLVALRLAAGAVLLLCLAHPRRVEETITTAVPEAAKTMVVFDTSSSMTQPGLLGPSRLDDAVALWRRVDPGKGEVRCFGFDRTVTQYPSLEALSQAAAAGGEVRPTNLAAALAETSQRAAADGFRKLVFFTDGIDTVDDNAVAAAAATLAANPVPVELVAADTELSMKRYVALTRLESPTRVAVNTRAGVAALVAYSNLVAADELTALLSDDAGTEIFRTTAVRDGAGGTALFRGELPAQATLGTRRFRLTLLVNGTPVGGAAWSVETVARERQRILLYQGTYDWAARFFKTALGRDAERTELEVRTCGARQGRNEFPGAEELRDFDAVFLLNLERKQCTPAMESALEEFLKNGGGVLFITGNPAAAAEFSDSPLEAMLPVEFESDNGDKARSDTQTSNFSNQIEGYRHTVNDRAEALLISQKEETFRPEPMTAFVLTPTGTASPIFRRPAGGAILPRYLDLAPVRALKPGAEALATGPGPGGKPRVVLAAQRYGRGRAAVLATDPLWRWRLALPAESQDCEFFWENLAGWLADAGKVTRGGWRPDSVLGSAGTPMTLRFTASGLSAEEAAALRFTAVDPDGRSHDLELRGEAGSGLWEGQFTPPTPGIWQLCAAGFPTQTITVQPTGGERELEQLAPDENFFQTAAQCDEVRLHRLSALGADPQSLMAATDMTAPPEGVIRLTESRETALWWRWELFALFLGLYLTELLLRRFMARMV